MMVRKKAMDAVGLLDERFFFFFEETDWTCRMRGAGWKVFFIPGAQIFHAQGQSVGHEAQGRLLFYRSRYQYLKKWFPKSYPLMVVAVIIRLLVNTLPDWNRGSFLGLLQAKTETEVGCVSEDFDMAPSGMPRLYDPGCPPSEFQGFRMGF